MILSQSVSEKIKRESWELYLVRIGMGFYKTN